MSLSVFAKIPVPAVELEHPLHYADSAVSVATLRKSLVSGELKSRLHRQLLDLKLNPQCTNRLSAYDFIAKGCNLGVSKHPTLDEIRLWIFASINFIFIFEFDDHFDKPLYLTPENIARASKELRDVLRSLSRHKLIRGLLCGSLEDWPTEVLGKEAYL